MSAAKIVACAKAWVGRNFRAGQAEQCMNFVRQCLSEAGSSLANKITASPVDGLWTGAGMASSLAGRDLGTLETNPDKLKPGTILFWNDTYEGDWPLNTITHVGIYEGNGNFIHRPTKARPVERASLTAGFWRAQFRCGLIPPEEAKAVAQPAPEPEKSTLKLVCHSGKIRAQYGNRPWADLDSFEANITRTEGGKKVARQVVGHSGKLRSRDGSGAWSDIDSFEIRGDFRP